MPFNRSQTNWQEQIIALVSLARPTHTAVPAQAAGAATELVVTKVPHTADAAALTRLEVIFDAAIAGGASANTATIQFRLYRAGALVGPLGNAYVTTEAAAAMTPVALLTAATELQADDVVTVQITSAGTGEALPAFLALGELSPSAHAAL